MVDHLSNSNPLSAFGDHEMRNSRSVFGVAAVVFVILLGFSPCARSEDSNDLSQKDSPLYTQLVYSRISNLTGIFSEEILKRLDFCVKDTCVF